MTTQENSRKTELCPESGILKDKCFCDECSPIVIDIHTSLMEARNINEITEKLLAILNLVNYLRTGGFEASLSSEGDYIIAYPPLVGGNYWMQCRGCSYPFLVEHAKEPETFCDSCMRIAVSSDPSPPQYYDDLFNYISVNLKNGRIPTGYDSGLPLTEEFCEAHSFDFEVIESRLNATGGYGPGEVMMNSMWSIPWFNRLPMKLTKDEEEEEE